MFNDTTGPYSANNLNGYGTPNESIAGATSVLRVTMADASSYDITLTGFPTTDKTLELVISGSQIGYPSGVIADQIINFKYIVTTALSTKITQVGAQGFYCNAKCCANSLFLDIDLDCEDCIKSLGDKLTKASILLDGLEYSAGCGNSTSFNKALAQLNKLCGNTECFSCK